MDVYKEIRVTYKIVCLILMGAIILFFVGYFNSRHYYNKRWQIFGKVTQESTAKIGTHLKINNIYFSFWGLTEEEKKMIQKGDSIFKPMGEKYFLVFRQDSNGKYYLKRKINFW